MPNKRYKAEQIVTLLRQIEVGSANGKPTPQACKEAEITIQTYYRWRKEYGGLKLDQAKRLKELERENAKLTIETVSDGPHYDLTVGPSWRTGKGYEIFGRRVGYIFSRTGLAPPVTSFLCGNL